MRCLQCQIGNHDNCLHAFFDIGQMVPCCCWECTDAQKAAAKQRDEAARLERFQKKRVQKDANGGRR